MLLGVLCTYGRVNSSSLQQQLTCLESSYPTVVAVVTPDAQLAGSCQKQQSQLNAVLIGAYLASDATGFPASDSVRRPVNCRSTRSCQTRDE